MCQGTDERLVQGVQPGVEPAKQHRVVPHRRDGDLDNFADLGRLGVLGCRVRRCRDGVAQLCPAGLGYLTGEDD